MVGVSIIIAFYLNR